MELNAPDGQISMFQAHDLLLIGLGRDNKTVGHGIALDDQRVIAGGFEWTLDTLKKRVTIMKYL